MPKTSTKKAPAKPAKTPPPSKITLSLDAPGMTPLHRAGLGGLAATLRVADLIRQNAEDEDEDLPALLEPLCAPEFSWNVERKTVTLDFGAPENAGSFFKALSDFAFQIRDDLIFLPGQYGVAGVGFDAPPLQVRARLQQGMTLTFLQHTGTRNLGEEKIESYTFDKKKIEYKYRPCSYYVHQDAWREKKWVDSKGLLSAKLCEFNGAICPGAVVRHAAFKSDTIVAQPVELTIPLTFALVGTISLPITGGTGAAIVPEVDDLLAFADYRALATPKDIMPEDIRRMVFAASLGDAVLRFELNRRGGDIKRTLENAGCDAFRLRTLPWATQQKSRCETLTLQTISRSTLEFYYRTLKHLRPRLISKTTEIKDGKGKKARVVDVKTEYFWKDSILRPFIADNIAQNRLWFFDFAKYARTLDPVSKKTYGELVEYERKELNAMMNDKELDWKLDGAKSLTFAVQEALRRLYARIFEETKNLAEQGRRNRLTGEYDKWRMAFAGAKTAEQFRASFADMLSRAKGIQELSDDRDAILKLLLADWSLARDLALLALAGYRGKGTQNDDAPDDSSAESESAE